ncbi:hypothetical protein SBOR_6783 [Sclerotinia borealis F-4128]|uniref:Uncharacterized protein n=1 Tax=Sclerotinia borealis (strain F-4128) TaxID=1432307 RepID=W9CDF7_SCLBF|nr:hypothetical protein SBOR_6783 [Sclerotinia borealis F-4128]
MSVAKITGKKEISRKKLERRQKEGPEKHTSKHDGGKSNIDVQQQQKQDSYTAEKKCEMERVNSTLKEDESIESEYNSCEGEESELLNEDEERELEKAIFGDLGRNGNGGVAGGGIK